MDTLIDIKDTAACGRLALAAGRAGPSRAISALDIPDILCGFPLIHDLYLTLDNHNGLFCTRKLLLKGAIVLFLVDDNE